MTRTGGGPMTPLEDRVRDAIAAKAAEVPPDAVPPLRLPAHRRSSFSLTHGGRERQGGLAERARAARAWAAPLAAAVGVAAALAVAFALTGVAHSSRPANSQPAGRAAPPPYYVALNFTGPEQCCLAFQLDMPQTRAVVRVTATGRPLASVTAPRPYDTFVGVTAAADDRTFVLAAQKLPHFKPDGRVAPPATRYFLLRFHPDHGHPRTTLTPLPIPVTPAGLWASEFALSPDGSRLAVVSGPGDKLQLTVYNLRAGTQRDYQSAGGVGNTYVTPYTEDALSWGTDNRTLAFVYGQWGGREGVWLLDTARPGSGLLANSRVAIPESRTTNWTQIQLTADGQTIIGNVNNPYQNGSLQHLVEVSARTGKLVRVLNVIRGMANDFEQVQWMSPSGRLMIVTNAMRARHHSTEHYASVDAGVLMNGYYTPLPRWSENTFTAAW
jgi:hypothetical protein